MGLFEFLKKSPAPKPPEFPAVLGAVAKGRFMSMAEIPDEVFSQGILGICCGIEPEEGRVYAPIDASVSQLTDTKHAIGLQAGEMELLVHIGVDTVEMNGDGFSSAVKEGTAVKKGDLLLTMDLEKIRAAGHPTAVILAVTNADEFGAVEPAGSGLLCPGDAVLKVSK